MLFLILCWAYGMEIVRACVPLPSAFSADTVKVKLPLWVGVPSITPVVEISLSPGGSSPSVMLQRIGAKLFCDAVIW